MSIDPMDAVRHLCEASNWQISNLKIQKILYISDMNFVGITKDRLVNEDFEAWDYGPVLPSIYYKCKAFGSKPVPNIFWDASAITDEKRAKILDIIWSKLKNLTPGQLVAATHAPSGAWAQRYMVGQRGVKITTQDMINEYERTKKVSS